MASSSKSENVHHIRCNSLPSKSHPATLQIEEELNKLKKIQSSSMPTADKMYQLENFYKYIDALLGLPMIQQSLFHHKDVTWVNELVDQSMRLLEICGSTKEMMSQVKEQVRDLQSALRRRKGDSSIESSISKYTSFRRRTKKDAKRLIASLNQVDNQIGASPFLDLDNHLVLMVRVLREVSAVGISLFQSLLVVFSASASSPKATRWSMFWTLISKGPTSTDDLSKLSESHRRS